MKEKIINFFSFLFLKYEYVYIFTLDFAADEKKAEKERKIVVELIKKDCKKELEYFDFKTNLQDGKTSYISASFRNKFLVPILYEFYAYSITKNEKKFTYDYKTIEKEGHKILKFKVKCYGKR